MLYSKSSRLVITKKGVKPPTESNNQGPCRRFVVSPTTMTPSRNFILNYLFAYE